MMSHTAFEQKIRITGKLVFDTAFHIGSGKEGELATDMGVLKDEQGWPALPGSTLKGCFRTTAEKLAVYLNSAACLLDTKLSGVECVGDQQFFLKVNEQFKQQKSEQEKLTWLDEHTCDICRLFGSPLQSSRIFFSDGRLSRWSGGYQVRDGVVIDRDSGTARPKLKYDFEASPKGTDYEIFIEIENPLETELALTAAVIAEWQTGFRLGGFTSRGLGRVFLTDLSIEQVDYRDADQLKDYLLKRKMQPAGDLLEKALQRVLNAEGGA
jgi:CRISPR-associated RAMP protein (TIGR02581 family)